MKIQIATGLAAIALLIGAAPAAQASTACDDALAWQAAHNARKVNTRSKASVDAYNLEADRIDAAIAANCGHRSHR